VDRWTGADALARIFVLNGVSGLLRAGSPFAFTPDDLKKLPGFRPDMAANRAEARRLLAEAGKSDLKIVLTNRPDYTPLGIFLIDQWRQIGVTATQEQPENQRYFASLYGGNFDVIVDATQDYVDEPLMQFQSAPSFDINPNNRARAIDRTIDELYEAQTRATDLTRRMALVHELESRLMNEAYRVPLFWSKRYTVMASELRGYEINTPSNLVGQDLADLWLAQ
jgi:peptide/nickel transport system substrate-binding protein